MTSFARALVAAVVLTACVHPPTPGVLTAQAIEWNPGRTAIGHIATVSESAEGVLLTSDQGVWILTGGAASMHDSEAPAAVDSDTIPSTTGEGTWLALVGADGHVRRLLAGRVMEDITARYGLGDAHVHAIAGAGRSVTGFVLDRAVAVSDGTSVSRFDCGNCTSMAGGGGRVAALGGSTVRVYDPAIHQRIDYRVPNARWITVDGRGRLAVATSDSVWVETSAGSLRRMYDSPDGSIHGLAASRHRVWFAAGTELGAVEDDGVTLTHGAGIDVHARLIAARGGEVWTLSNGTLARYGAAEGPAGSAWDERVRGTFARSCARCHTAGASGGLDLSSWGAWIANRELITDRVLRRRDMPPAGNPIRADDRDALAQWLAAGAGAAAVNAAQSP